MSRPWLIACCYLAMATSHAQEYPKREWDLSRIADELVGFQDQDANYEDIYENLMQILSNPVDLNRASAEDLRMLYVLRESQIEAIIKYREQRGSFLSVYELQAVPELDLFSIHKLIPFVRVADPGAVMDGSLINRARYESNSYLLTRYEQTLETKRGYEPQDDASKQFHGSPGRLYTRFRSARSGDFSIGFTAEKDAGEQLAWNGKKRFYGTDFWSGHVQVMNKGRLRNLIVGDYQCQFGQGLVLGSAFGLGKGAETIMTTRKSNVGSLPYASVNESGFYRGISATWEPARHVYLTTFYSRINRDASVESSDEDGTTISSFQYTGLHRNDSELKNRKRITEQNAGMVINYRKSGWDAGIMAEQIKFDHPINKNPTLYNQFAFQGEENKSASAFINYTWNNVTFFSESARSFSRSGGGMAGVAGLLGSVHKNLDIAVVYRKYDRDYHTFYANAFAENSQPQNETGLYWGWKYAWNRKYTFSGYTDVFRFPWLAYRRYTPSSGYEWLLKVSYQPTKKILLFAQMREESKQRNTANNGNLYTVSEGVKRNGWINVDYGITEHLRLKTRAQFSSYSIGGKTTHGMVLLQDIHVAMGKLSCSARYALFDTEDYDNRQYVYENDVWMSFSLPAYDGIGVRSYVVVEYTVSKTISLWVRYSRTKYTDRNSIGSGLETIDGNQKNDIKFQALIHF